MKYTKEEKLAAVLAVIAGGSESTGTRITQPIGN